jgi:hypothetical protein
MIQGTLHIYILLCSTLQQIFAVDVRTRPHLWFSSQSSWLQIQRSGFDSVIQERGPLSLMSTIEELLGRKSSVSGLEIREYGRRDHSR